MVSGIKIRDMARTLGAKQHTSDEFNYIRSNWRQKTDAEMAKHLGVKETTLQKMRYTIGCRRSRSLVTDRNKIADILVFFANGKTITDIAKLVGKSVHVVDRIIDKHYIKKKVSPNTITIILRSKI